MTRTSAVRSLQENWLNKGISRPDALHHSFFGRLPGELIIEIFTICTYNDYPEYPGLEFLPPFEKELPSLRNDKSPLTLCHICTRFRHLALNSPILWSRFELITMRGIARSKDTAITWTALSGNAPLTFAIRVPQSHDTSYITDTSLRSILNVLGKYISRWKHVDLIISNETALKMILSLASRSEGLLETIKITGLSQHSLDITSLISPFAPYLKRIYIHGFNFTASLGIASLKYLSISSDVTFADLLRLFDGCPSLEFIDVGVRGPALEPNWHRLTHGLKILRLKNRDAVEPVFSKLLDLLTLPSLVELALEGVQKEDSPLPSLATFFQRSFSQLPSAPLSRLSINANSWDHMEYFLRALSYVSHLKVLSVCFVPLTNEILQEFAIDENEIGLRLCPDLEEFIWYYCSQISNHVLANMLRSRWNLISPKLSLVDLRYCRLRTEELLQDPVISQAVCNGARLQLS